MLLITNKAAAHFSFSSPSPSCLTSYLEFYLELIVLKSPYSAAGVGLELASMILDHVFNELNVSSHTEQIQNAAIAYLPQVAESTSVQLARTTADDLDLMLLGLFVKTPQGTLGIGFAVHAAQQRMFTGIDPHPLWCHGEFLLVQPQCCIAYFPCSSVQSLDGQWQWGLMPVSQVQWLKTREGVEMHAEMIEHAITCNMPSSGKHYELIEIIPLLWCYRSGCTPHPCISSIPSILCKSMEVLTLPWYSQCGLPVAPCFGILVNAHNTVGYPASTELSMSPANKCDLVRCLTIMQSRN